jgi:hypothetical protein
MDIAIAEKKAVEKAFEAATNGVIMTAGALGDEFYNYTTDKVNGWKDMYYEGVRMGGTDGEKMKMDAMMQMQNWSTFVQNHKQWNIDYAETKKEDMLSSYMSIDDKHDITQVLDKKYTLGENTDGEMVFNITGRDGVKKQLTHAQYEDLMVIKNYTVDKTYTGVLNNSYKSRTFDRESTEWQILQSLPTDLKQFGAAMADGVQGQSLSNMLTKSKKDGTLSQEIIEAIDTDKDKNISDEELDLYIDVITNTKNPMFDLERSRRIFAERLTNSIQGKHKSAWDENDRVKRIGEYTPTDKEEEDDDKNYGGWGGYSWTTKGTKTQAGANITWIDAEKRRNDLDNFNPVGGKHGYYTWDADKNLYIDENNQEFTMYEVADIEGLIKPGESAKNFNIATKTDQNLDEQRASEGLATSTMMKISGDDAVSSMLNNTFDLSDRQQPFLFVPWTTDLVASGFDEGEVSWAYDPDISDSMWSNDISLVDPTNNYRPLIDPKTNKPYRFKTGKEFKQTDLDIINKIMKDAGYIKRQKQVDDATTYTNKD